VVFCLRNQQVKVVGATPITISREEIISAANLKNGQSIFMVDKNKAIQNIESKYPYVKVVQIKTTDLMSVDIIVRARHEMFYTEFNNNCYILDEELKVLDIVQPGVEPINLTKIENGNLNIDELTLKCDFVGTKKQSKIVSNLFKSMVTVVTKDGQYLEREDVKDVLSSIKFETFNTFDKVIITTSYGVKLDIENPSHNLQYKINVCFSTIDEFLIAENNKEKSGTIKLYFDLENNMQCVYISE